MSIKTESSMQTSMPWLAAAGLSAGALFLASKLANSIRRRPVDLSGKVALITGGSRGLGLAIAQEFARQGARLALVARDAAELENAAAQVRALSAEVAVFPTDITQNNSIQTLVGEVINRFGRIDILVNDAGMIKVAPFENVTHDDFEEAMKLMFWAPVNLTLAVLPHMRQRNSGHIVNITSVGGRVAVPHLLPYSCAKFAFTGFSTGLSSELEADEIHVLTVVPGLMRTGSYLNAGFKGAPEHEFAWFSLLGNLPGFSVSAAQAAAEIRSALQRRRLTCTISLPAKILIHSESLLPEATRTAMQFVNRLALPRPGQEGTHRGKTLNPKFGVLFQAFTSLGRLAAGTLNEA